MIIKTQMAKKYISLMWLSTFLMTSVYVLINSYIFAIINLLILSSISLVYTISVGRMFVLNNEGCTVTFMNKKQFYSWNELYIKIEDCNKKIILDRYGCKYDKCLVISHRKSPNSLFAYPNFYSLFIHPFSFIYMYLSDANALLVKEINGYYVVDERVLMQKLNDWNVRIDVSG